MKNLISISIFALTSLLLNSCVSISNTPDDDVYTVKSSQIPVGESLDDETNYGAYKYKKDRNNNNVSYSAGGGMNNFDPFFMGGLGYRPNHFGYNPYQMYAYPYYNDGSWAYIPGYGWSYVSNPYFGNPFYGGYGNYYNNFNHGYYSGFNNGNGWNNNGWNNGNNWNNNNSNGSGSVSSNINHHSGPRGSSGGGGVVTRSNIPGTLKNTNSTFSSSHSSGAGAIVKPVGKESVMSRNNPGKQSEITSRANENTDFSRPGRIQGGISSNSRGGSSATNSRNSSIFNGLENNSGNSSTRGSSGSVGSSSSPGRNGGGSIGSSSTKTGGSSTGGNNSGGGSTSRPASGASSGGRK